MYSGGLNMLEGTTLIVYGTKKSESIANEYDSPIALTSTIGMLTVFNGVLIDDNYKLAKDLIAEVKIENDNYVVFDYQVEEYGIGNSLEEAQQDLLYSLIDYLVSLERREPRLADKELSNLQVLRDLVTTV